jgi:hypothetical protein
VLQSVNGEGEARYDKAMVAFWTGRNNPPDTLNDGIRLLALDLHARHVHLLAQSKNLEERLRADPRWYDVECGAWFAWGQSLWIGTGFYIPGHRQSGWNAKRKHQHVDGA